MPEDHALIGDRYLLGDLLGVGGSASVFAATVVGGSSGLDADVRRAVKLLHPHLCADDAARSAFLAEAERVGRISHPNVVRVYGAGLHDAGGVVQPWIALDLLTGPTLAEWVAAAGPLPPADAAAVVDGLLAGLEAAHRAQIVHRDVSPRNIVLEGALDRRAQEPLRADMVRVLDFGLAGVRGSSTVGRDVLLAGAGSAADAGTAVDTDAASSPGGVGVVGSAAFMSPEQASGRGVWAVSDLYQAGAVLYFALTGQVPYPRSTRAETLRAHLSAPPPVPSALVAAARPFDRVVTTAMAKSPTRRYRDAGEFRAALTRAAALAGTDAAASAPASGSVVPGDGSLVAAGTDERTGPTSLLPGTVAGSAVDYLAAPPDPPDTGAAATPRRSSGGFGAVAAVLGVGAVAAAIVWGLLAAPATGGQPDATPSDSAATASTPSSTPLGTSTPVVTPTAAVTVAVPALSGTLADATAALAAAGLTLGAVTRADSARPADSVLSQNPAPGSAVSPGAAIEVTAASGSNVVPTVTGLTVTAAAAALRSAGFSAGQSGDAAVTGTMPPAGTVLPLGLTVALLTPVSTPTPTPTPTPSPTSSPTASGRTP